jgi:hypothetical protein
MIQSLRALLSKIEYIVAFTQVISLFLIFQGTFLLIGTPLEPESEPWKIQWATTPMRVVERWGQIRPDGTLHFRVSYYVTWSA